MSEDYQEFITIHTAARDTINRCQEHMDINLFDLALKISVPEAAKQLDLTLTEANNMYAREMMRRGGRVHTGTVAHIVGGQPGTSGDTPGVQQKVIFAGGGSYGVGRAQVVKDEHVHVGGNAGASASAASTTGPPPDTSNNHPWPPDEHLEDLEDLMARSFFYTRSDRRKVDEFMSDAVMIYQRYDERFEQLKVKVKMMELAIWDGADPPIFPQDIRPLRAYIEAMIRRMVKPKSLLTEFRKKD